jgi:hypothetical protein
MRLELTPQELHDLTRHRPPPDRPGTPPDAATTAPEIPLEYDDVHLIYRIARKLIDDATETQDLDAYTATSVASDIAELVIRAAGLGQPEQLDDTERAELEDALFGTLGQVWAIDLATRMSQHEPTPVSVADEGGDL